MSLDPEEALDLVFRALADRTRRHILRTLAAGDRRMEDLAEPFHLTAAAVAAHIDVLERADLVRRLHQGAHDWLQLRMPPLKRASRWMAFYEQFGSTQLEELESLLAQPAKNVPRDVGR